MSERPIHIALHNYADRLDEGIDPRLVARWMRAHADQLVRDHQTASTTPTNDVELEPAP